MHPTIGIITLGQTPRIDMIPSIWPFIPSDTTIIEKGVLDNKSKDEIIGLIPEPGQTTLVSRLRNGNKAVIAKEKVLPIIQNLINQFNQMKVDTILLACTGKFQLFYSQIPVVYPDFLLNHVVKGLFHEGEIGVIVPLPEQTLEITSKWKAVKLSVSPKSCSPYNFVEANLIRAAQELDQLPVKAIILDCMGYTEEMMHTVQDYTSKPVLLSRNIVYRLIAVFLE